MSPTFGAIIVINLANCFSSLSLFLLLFLWSLCTRSRVCVVFPCPFVVDHNFPSLGGDNMFVYLLSLIQLTLGLLWPLGLALLCFIKHDLIDMFCLFYFTH